MRNSFWNVALFSLLIVSCSGNSSDSQMPTAQNTADAVARQSAVEESSSDVLEEVELNQAKEEVSSGPIIENAESVVYRDQDLVRLQVETPEIFSRISVTETEEVFDGITVSLTTVRSPTLLGDTLFFVMHDEEDEAGLKLWSGL